MSAYRTGPVQALGHRFEVVTSDHGLGAYLDRLFAAMVRDDASVSGPVARYTVEARAGAQPSGPVWEVALDGREIVRTPEAATALAMLLWDVNRAVVERTDGLLLLHAAAAERDGSAVVLPGAMEAGKTTVVAGLLRAGLRYLTDEVTAIDVRRRWVHPYPKALSVDPGSWGVLADLRPEAPAGAAAFLPDQWQVIPPPEAVAGGASVRLLVLPRYESGAPLALTHLTRADALVAVSGCAFRFADDPAGNMAALASVLAHCDTYELLHSDLEAAVEAVIGLLDALAGEEAAGEAAGGAQDDDAPPDASLRGGGETPGGGKRRRAPRGDRGPMPAAIRPDDVSLDFAPRRHPGVTGVELDGEVVLYAGEARMHKLDAIATVLWNCFDGSVTLAELVSDLDSVYVDAGSERISADVLDCVRQLGRQGLLENVAPQDGAA